MNKTLIKVFRFLLYIFSKVITVAAIAALLVLIFIVAQDSMNVNVMVKDVMGKRAAVMLINEDNQDTVSFTNVFTEKYLKESGILNREKDPNYNITSFTQRTDVDFALIFPWQNSVNVTVYDEVDSITGEYIGDQDGGVLDFQNGYYRVKVLRVNGEWKIDKITLTKRVDLPELPKYNEDAKDENTK